ncbi:hypothetical protein PHLCEN_2v7784 [Hermanssonia centrifuga]|uniref:Uncharacterized protein n=1 Tax=Hermanssonia centrifuga TaxID=98765 RepID=A0A2R6NVI2_9APHY|nr:hypothetical protein PHLCEN_2v7784 [Hermanssonia centrifuga]
MRSGVTLYLAAVISLACHAWGQTSLYIPGFDPQPVTANELGVGADGETTWLIAPGVTSGSFEDSGFFGPATLIAGPTQAEIIYDDPSGYRIQENCGINGDTAECTALLVTGTYTSTYITEETVVPFEVQAGSSVAPSDGASVPTSALSAGSTVPTAAKPTSPPIGSSTQSSSTSSSPAPTNSENSVAKLARGSLVAWLAPVLLSLGFLTVLA